MELLPHIQQLVPGVCLLPSRLLLVLLVFLVFPVLLVLLVLLVHPALLLACRGEV